MYRTMRQRSLQPEEMTFPKFCVACHFNESLCFPGTLETFKNDIILRCYYINMLLVSDYTVDIVNNTD